MRNAAVLTRFGAATALQIAIAVEGALIVAIPAVFALDFDAIWFAAKSTARTQRDIIGPGNTLVSPRHGRRRCIRATLVNLIVFENCWWEFESKWVANWVDRV